MRVKPNFQVSWIRWNVCGWGGEGIGCHDYFEALLGRLYNIFPYLSLKWEKHSFKFLPPPTIPKTTWINTIALPLAACHICSSPPTPRFCSRRWQILARWTQVTSRAYKVESNNKHYKRRDMLHYLIIHSIRTILLIGLKGLISLLLNVVYSGVSQPSVYIRIILRAFKNINAWPQPKDFHLIDLGKGLDIDCS